MEPGRMNYANSNDCNSTSNKDSLNGSQDMTSDLTIVTDGAVSIAISEEEARRRREQLNRRPSYRMILKDLETVTDKPMKKELDDANHLTEQAILSSARDCSVMASLYSPQSNGSALVSNQTSGRSIGSGPYANSSPQQQQQSTAIPPPPPPPIALLSSLLPSGAAGIPSSTTGLVAQQPPGTTTAATVVADWQQNATTAAGLLTSFNSAAESIASSATGLQLSSHHQPPQHHHHHHQQQQQQQQSPQSAAQQVNQQQSQQQHHHHHLLSNAAAAAAVAAAAAAAHQQQTSPHQQPPLHHHHHPHPQHSHLAPQSSHQQSFQPGVAGGVNVVNMVAHGLTRQGSASLTSISDTDDTNNKRQVRLLKNREAAKECRRKKKEYVKCLENRVAVLENQNKALIEELKTLKDLYCRKEKNNVT